MEFQQNVRVYSAHDEYLGKVDRLVFDPVARSVSHIVVRKGVFFPEDKVISIASVATATGERINLENGVEPETLPLFEERHYVPLDDVSNPHGSDRPAPPDLVVAPIAWYGPFGVLAATDEAFLATVTARNIPERAVAMEPGVSVITVDGHEAGRLEQVVATESGRATHIVVTERGSGLGDRAVPITFVEDIATDSLRLSVDGATIERLPDFVPGGSLPLPPPSATVAIESDSVEISGYRLQSTLADLADLTLQIQHLRWNLDDDDLALRSKLDDFDALVRASADAVASGLRALGVAPDGRVGTIYRDLLFDPLPPGPFSGPGAVGALARRLTQFGSRIRESIDVLTEADDESSRLLEAISVEFFAWAEKLNAAD